MPIFILLYILHCLETNMKFHFIVFEILYVKLSRCFHRQLTIINLDCLVINQYLLLVVFTHTLMHRILCYPRG